MARSAAAEALALKHARRNDFESRVSRCDRFLSTRALECLAPALAISSRERARRRPGAPPLRRVARGGRRLSPSYSRFVHVLIKLTLLPACITWHPWSGF